MLFCSQQFLLFFCLVFFAYWTMPAKRVRACFSLLAGAGFGYLSWNYLKHVSSADWQAVLAQTNWFYWLSGIIFSSTLLAYRIGHDRARVWLLLLASFCFYASWNSWLAAIICVTTAMDYLVARGMDGSANPFWRRALLVVSLIVNLGLLVYFKYANFFLTSLDEALRAAGVTSSMPVLKVILPIGISFYTFEAINYTIDVYRRRVRAERNLANFMLFITFFPHLVAGPIVRARDFLPQIRRRKRFDWARMQLGVQFFLLGLFKKMAIADRMALFADPVFANPEQYNSGAVWIATLAFTLRIYCDFSGYTDMALGAAHMLNYKLALNFNMPYLAKNVSEFWHRWHISLSSWLRDYLFIPLGGSRGSNWQTCRNLLLTMTLGGLWHGISWMFVVWGLLHGLYLVIHRGFKAFCQQRPTFDALLNTIPGTLCRIALTFLCVVLGWVIFFTASLEADAILKQAEKNVADGARVNPITYNAFQASMTVLHRMVIHHDGLKSPLHNSSLFYTWAVVILCHIVVYFGLWKRYAPLLPAPVLGFSYALVLTMALVLAPDSGKAFIYFQF